MVYGVNYMGADSVFFFKSFLIIIFNIEAGVLYGNQLKCEMIILLPFIDMMYDTITI